MQGHKIGEGKDIYQEEQYNLKDVRKEIVQQEKVFIELADAKNIPNDQWGFKGVFINGKTSEDILSIPKGQRPAPSTYLSSGYIQQHLAKFEKEGGAFIVVKS